jgi:hypothetical protein
MSDRKTHSTIDLVLTNGLHDISQPVTVDQFGSDHLPVIFDVYSGSLSLNPRTKIPCYKRANWPSFMSYLNRELDLQNISLSTISDSQDIDLMVNHLTFSILEAKNIAVPNVVPYRYKLKLTEEISELIRFRNQCRRRWSRSKNRDLKKFGPRTSDCEFLLYVIGTGVDCLNRVEETKPNCGMSQNCLRTGIVFFHL